MALQVKSRVAVLNQRHPERTIWKESAICTKTWNSSVLQLIDVSIQLLALSCTSHLFLSAAVASSNIGGEAILVHTLWLGNAVIKLLLMGRAAAALP